MQHICGFMQGAMKNNLKASPMIKSLRKENWITTDAGKHIFTAKKLWFQYSCSCKHCQLGLTCGRWWREALKLDESCTPPGLKFAWLNQFLRLKHCWHMEERMTAKANNRFVGRSAGRETDSIFLSPDSREDRRAAALFKGHCETASRGGILMPGLTPLMKTQRRQPHYQTHTSTRLPPAAS